MIGSPNFSIITPSFNMLNYLKMCAASISDQFGITYEHLIIDGGSTDGTLQWLQSQDKIKFISESDNGMYDALNKGLRVAKGDIIAYLNCDEQYLSNTLSYVKEFFQSNPDIDVIFGDFFVIDNNGDILSFKKGFTPRSLYIKYSHLYLFTCTLFFEGG